MPRERLGKIIIYLTVPSLQPFLDGRYEPFSMLLTSISLSVFFVCGKGEIDFALYTLVMLFARVSTGIIPEMKNAVLSEAVFMAEHTLRAVLL